ncbi:hypothetical protein [Okeania sp. SIO2G5]|uniref:hypothetical protein n=1 Tax=Okeania sp. SIO2G5 TaxID=2607796 RepID=UPI0013C25200|nr:hypothetical protein [Okeania sp. SIO2G5]NEP76143.1 hypothetical protein [Okeania sp. SIO2G5]
MPDDRKRLTVYLEDNEKADWEVLCKIRKRSTSAEAQILIINEVKAAKENGEMPSSERKATTATTDNSESLALFIEAVQSKDPSSITDEILDVVQLETGLSLAEIKAMVGLKNGNGAHETVTA